MRTHDPSSEPTLILLYTVVTLAIAAAAILAWDRRWLPRPWTYVATTAAGKLASTLLERIRGIQHLTKVRPVTMTPSADQTHPAYEPYRIPRH